ncbi:unnamed protein product [Parnassius mnemosyne]|uniref:Transmembrane protein 208 n=1 Tax=Parnassius mnemosyne TaxID=213953 RepID=A0AAV1L0Z2_9NEOP
MPPPQKGKAPTRGAKQILSENGATVLFYRNMSLGASGLYNVITFIFFYHNMSYLMMTMNIVATIIYIICYQLMRFISRPRYSEDGHHLVDPGLDLNMDGGMGEHLKDVVILTSLIHLSALISNFFWLLLLLIPLRAFWLIWMNILSPWIFEEVPEDTEQDEKKRKKMERKMKRYQQ